MRDPLGVGDTLGGPFGGWGTLRDPVGVGGTLGVAWVLGTH